MDWLDELLLGKGGNASQLIAESEEDKMWMQMMFEEGEYEDKCFPYVTTYNGKVGLEIYVWSLIYEKQYTRFVILQGVDMSIDERVEFDYWCKEEDIYVGQKAMQSIFAVFSGECPEIHLVPYTNPMHMFHHIYYATRVGIRELLYKANLGYLALYFDEISDCNLLATSITSVFDGLPLRLLRIVNTKFGAKILSTSKNREILYELYVKKQKLFTTKWSIGKCKYFANVICSREGKEFWEEDEIILNHLDFCRNEMDYDRFARYLELREELKDIVKLDLIPDETKTENYLSVAESLYQCLKRDKEKWQMSLDLCYCMRGYQYEYDDDKYKITFFPTFKDIYEEAVAQSNCLWGCREMAASGEALYYSMRPVEKPDKSYITLEIRDGVIEQAFRRFNENISEEEEEWLADYAVKMNLIMDLEDYDDY